MQRETIYDPVFDAQAHYRLLLDSMARPGKINVLPRLELSVPPGTSLTDAAALVGFALLNADISFFADGEDAEFATRYLLVNTSGKPVDAEEADFVFASGAASGVLVESMKKGTLPYPEEGATLVVSIDALTAEAQGLAITLQGPGVAGKKTFFVRGLNVGLLSALQHSNMEFPLGVDLILVDAHGHLACIPRSSQVSWEVISTY